MGILEIKNLTFTYPTQSKPALREVSFMVEEGEFVVLCGATGCGKSTLLQLIKPALQPFGHKKGECLYQGMSIDELSSYDGTKDIGFVMQNPDTQIVANSVLKELAFGLENLGVSKEEMQLRVAEIASYFGMEEWFSIPTNQLSGGQKQLLNLASVLIMDPKILLLDEPTSQLDPIAAMEFIHTLYKINRELGITILVVEHRLEEIFGLADKVLVLDKGSIVGFDHPSKIGRIAIQTNSLLMQGMPSAIRMYEAIDGRSESPLTVKDGKKYIQENILVTQDTIQKNSYKRTKSPIVTIQDAWFRYDKDKIDVLKGLSLDIEEGEIISIVGGNGSGKTTLLRTIAKLEKPYSGKIWLFNKLLRQYKSHELYHNMLAMLPQNPSEVFIKNTIADDFLELLKNKPSPKSEKDRLLAMVINLFQLDDLLDKHPNDLSGGELQKAAFAKVLLLEPKIILLDEPTKGLDPSVKHEYKNILDALKEQGVTIVLVTHDVEFAAMVSDEVALLFNGIIVTIQDPTTFFTRNQYYTTAASRMTRGIFTNTITVEEVIELIQKNGGYRA